MKYLIALLIVVQIGLFSRQSQAQVTNIDNSPYNVKNSPYNVENSPYNVRNSPYNVENSQYNVNSKNGVYDNSGNRIGYEVKAPSGVTNIFDNNGNRIGYSPSTR